MDASIVLFCQTESYSLNFKQSNFCHQETARMTMWILMEEDGNDENRDCMRYSWKFKMQTFLNLKYILS